MIWLLQTIGFECMGAVRGETEVLNPRGLVGDFRLATFFLFEHPSGFRAVVRVGPRGSSAHFAHTEADAFEWKAGGPLPEQRTAREEERP